MLDVVSEVWGVGVGVLVVSVIFGVWVDVGVWGDDGGVGFVVGCERGIGRCGVGSGVAV